MTEPVNVIRELESGIAAAVDAVPQLKRGVVWCHACGHSQEVDTAACLRLGWPLHCGATMSIDSPAERAAQAKGAPS